MAEEQRVDQQVTATSLHAVLDKNGDGTVDDLECNGENDLCSVVNGACVCEKQAFVETFYKATGKSDAKEALVQLQSAKVGCDTRRCVKIVAEGEDLCACSQPQPKDDEDDGKAAGLVQTSTKDTSPLLSENCLDWDKDCRQENEGFCTCPNHVYEARNRLLAEVKGQ